MDYEYLSDLVCAVYLGFFKIKTKHENANTPDTRKLNCFIRILKLPTILYTSTRNMVFIADNLLN